jgi:hypothetical protein
MIGFLASARATVKAVALDINITGTTYDGPCRAADFADLGGTGGHARRMGS